jgi:hypothetical protein
MADQLICIKTIFDVLYHFSNFWKKSIMCAEDLILREKNFHGKKCYNMCLNRFFMCCRPCSQLEAVNYHTKKTKKTKQGAFHTDIVNMASFFYYESYIGLVVK